MYSDSHQPDASPGATDYLSTDQEGSSGITRLLHRVAQQDRNAFAELYEATAPKLLATVLRILKDRAWADDVMVAEFVLGTLPEEERDALHARRAREPELEALIQQWEARLALEHGHCFGSGAGTGCRAGDSAGARAASPILRGGVPTQR